MVAEILALALLCGVVGLMAILFVIIAVGLFYD